MAGRHDLFRPDPKRKLADNQSFRDYEKEMFKM